MPTSTISQTLTAHKDTLLNEWLRDQLAATTMRPDLISEAQLREDSTRFLGLLEKAAAADETLSTSSPAFAPVRELLDELSRDRGRQGFTPSETAMFVFSFKQPLLNALQKTQSGDSLLKSLWSGTRLLDELGLRTIESFQSAREEVIRRQQEDMMELSTPVVRLWDGVVAVPLIGTLDSNRTNMVMEALLTAIVSTRSEIAIIDITGVPTVDTLVAQHLLKTVAATRLMGADCIISGIRPQIAQTMVHLQIDLSTVTTKSTLAEALLLALRRTGYNVTRSSGTANK
jgi:rsbT co-antagonist protein RsbR